MVMPNLTQEQLQAIAQMQTFTKFIKAEVERGSNSSVTIRFLTDNEQAKQFLPQLQASIITSVANLLYSLFGIEGKII